MGSITESKKVDKQGKQVTTYRAYIRREDVSRSKVFATRTEAKAWIRENESPDAIKAFAKKAKTGRDFNDLVEDFVKLGDCAYAKFSHLDFWKAAFADKQVADITHADINTQKLTLKSREAMRTSPTGLKPTGKLISPASVNRYLATLSAIFTFAMEHGLIDDHPMKGGKVKKLEESKGRRRILTPDEEHPSAIRSPDTGARA